MSFGKILRAGPIALIAASAAPQAHSQDLERGRARSVDCVACHGPAGVTANPTFPNIAGQNAAYLGMQLQNFKSGERYHALMTPVAQTLSEQDIHDLAAYFSTPGAAGETADVRPAR